MDGLLDYKIKRFFTVYYKYIFRTPEDIRKGLMFKKNEIENDQVALFVMSEYKVHSFWMKNTYISLDMIFLDYDGKILGYIADATPLDENKYSILKPSKYVIEANAGFVERYNMKIGDTIRLPKL